MSASRDTEYCIALAAGFLAEAEQDFTLQRWRSCVDNAQLAVENAGKAALTLFGISPKTHDPARQIAAVLREQEMPAGSPVLASIDHSRAHNRPCDRPGNY